MASYIRKKYDSKYRCTYNGKTLELWASEPGDAVARAAKEWRVKDSFIDEIQVKKIKNPDNTVVAKSRIYAAADDTAFTIDEMIALGEEIGINWDNAEFDVNQFIKGFEVELEHGMKDAETNVTDDDPITTAKIAWAHLKELPDYYDRLAKIEK